MKILVATRNNGKLREIEHLFAGQGIEISGLETLADAPEVVEDGATFVANASKKACEVAAVAGCLTLADDSGLVVPALGGEPGVSSARYAGADATDEANNRKLRKAIETLPAAERQAYFCCVVALADPAGNCRTFEGRVNGQLLSEPRGQQGFGYDPLFLVPEYGKTMAELPIEIKNRISHRGKALGALLDALRAGPLF